MKARNWILLSNVGKSRRNFLSQQQYKAFLLRYRHTLHSQFPWNIVINHSICCFAYEFWATEEEIDFPLLKTYRMLIDRRWEPDILSLLFMFSILVNSCLTILHVSYSPLCSTHWKIIYTSNKPYYGLTKKLQPCMYKCNVPIMVKFNIKKLQVYIYSAADQYDVQSYWP